MQRWGGALFTLLSLAALGCLLWLAPGVWRQEQQQRLYVAWNDGVQGEADAIEKLFVFQPSLPSGFPSGSAEVRGLLDANPTLCAVIPRGRTSPVWIREGEGFAASSGPLRDRYLQWAKRAEAESLPKWHPPPALDPDAGTMPSLVLVGRSWIFIKRWRIGSPEVEAHLRLALGPHPRSRVGVWHYKDKSEPPHSPAFEPPNLQTWPGSSMKNWNASWISTDLGPGWELVCQPWPEVGESWNRQVEVQVWRVRAGVFAVVLCFLLGLAFRHAGRRRDSLTADRLASLTHSLKTPLALHKLRCDSLRMGRLDARHAAEELLRLGQEVDDLTRIIERALVSIHGSQGHEDRQEISRNWLQVVADEWIQAFEEAGRILATDLSDEPGRAHRDSLHSALQTLLENAYHHGQGQVRLRSRSTGRGIAIQISDQGPGLDAAALAVLGQPFLRLRESGQEGFSHEGQGLGLSLLFQVARQEGWGLDLESQPGEGLTVTLGIAR